MEMLYRYIPADTGLVRLRVSRSFDNHDRSLSVVQKNVRALEFAIPFPCTKSKVQMWQSKEKGHYNRYVVMFYITLGADLTLQNAKKFLEGAGFRDGIE